MSHGIAGASRRPGKKNLPPSAREKFKQLPPPMATSGTQVAINRYKPESYNYSAFDAKGVCGIGECDYKEKKVRALHFHRSVKHGIRGINWNRASHIRARQGAKRKVGRPRKVA